jgi:hypothetical protein
MTRKVTGSLFKPAATARGLFLCSQEIRCIRPQPLPRRQSCYSQQQWTLTGFSLFCLVDAAVVMVLTPGSLAPLKLQL